MIILASLFEQCLEAQQNADDCSNVYDFLEVAVVCFAVVMCVAIAARYVRQMYADKNTSRLNELEKRHAWEVAKRDEERRQHEKDCLRADILRREEHAWTVVTKTWDKIGDGGQRPSPEDVAKAWNIVFDRQSDIDRQEQ